MKSAGVESAIAIIPARGGSKGIPRKNVRVVAGRPLIAHMICAARASQRLSRVIVSTDDPEIGKIAGEWQAEVVWRPKELATDIASSELALLHVLDELERRGEAMPQITVFLQCTSPLTTAADIDDAIDVLRREGGDSALTVTPFQHFLWKRDRNGVGIGVNHDKAVRQMRQEREPQYLETGAIYVMKTEAFRRARHRFFGRTVFHVVSPGRALEIDEPGDLELAERLLAGRAVS